MSKPLTIRIATEAANTIRKAIQMTLTEIGMTGEGAIKVTEITENTVKFEYTEEKQFTGSMNMAIDGNHYIIENVEIAEVVEAPAAEVITEEHTVTMSVEEKRAAWDIFVKEWAKSRADEIKAIRAAEAKTVNA